MVQHFVNINRKTIFYLVMIYFRIAPTLPKNWAGVINNGCFANQMGKAVRRH